MPGPKPERVTVLDPPQRPLPSRSGSGQQRKANQRHSEPSVVSPRRAVVRERSLEFVPDSEDENDTLPAESAVESHHVGDPQPSRPSNPKAASPEFLGFPSDAVDLVPDTTTPDHSPANLANPSPSVDPHTSRTRGNQPSDTSPNSVPFHRARAANPLVRMVDDFNPVEGGIAAKARLGGRNEEQVSAAAGPSSPSSSRRSKPGPGRSSPGMLKKNKSSLLTFENGELKSKKGKYIPPDRNEVQTGEGSSDLLGDDGAIPGLSINDTTSSTVPTGQELLELAGLDAQDASALEDFEDGAPILELEQNPEPEPQPRIIKSVLQQRSVPAQSVYCFAYS